MLLSEDIYGQHDLEASGRSGSQLYEVEGEVEAVIYRNEDNGYTVIELGGQETITAVGIMPMISVGEEVKLTGVFKTHPSYGKQLSVTVCQRSMPTTTAGILKYLSSGAIKGIGPAKAAVIVREFGENTIEVLENEPERVAKIKGITLKAAQEISERIKTAFGMRELIIYLGKYGINGETAVQVWKKLGNRAISEIEENPYLLCGDGIYLPFEAADRIAVDKSFPSDSRYRIGAAVTYVLNHNKRNGHTCLPENKLAATAASFISVEIQSVQNVLEDMTCDGSVIRTLIDGEPFIYTPLLFQSETYIAARINMLMSFPNPPVTDLENKIKEIEKSQHIAYADMQKTAIKTALQGGMLILTGGPGTGKTTTLKGIISILKSIGEKVYLAAPTGRAARRMTELTGCEAKTIHRLLEVTWNDDDRPVFKRNERNMLSCDTLIVDEVSMVDAVIFESVMRALPMGCRLILVGDTDQLPSVGAGNVLSDLIDSGTVPVVALTEIFRQSMESLIVTNAHRIVKGEMPEITVKDNDFFFMPVENKYRLRDTVKALCSVRLPSTYGFSPFEDIQVLCPGRRGELGILELNRVLQETLNPPSRDKEQVEIDGRIFRVGDKVMQTKNNYNLLWSKENGESGEGIFNGDVGRLEEIHRQSGSLKIRFDDKTAVYDREAIFDLEHAYAMTVHKSQGNEFEAVIIPLYRTAPKLKYRNLLYTAVTRAKKILIIIGRAKELREMVDNNRKTRRYSGLSFFLKEMKNSMENNG